MNIKATLQEILALLVPVLPGGLIVLLAEGASSHGSLLNSTYMTGVFPGINTRIAFVLLASWAIGRTVGLLQFLFARLIFNVWAKKLTASFNPALLWNSAIWRKSATVFLGPMSPESWDENAWKDWFVNFYGISALMRPAAITAGYATAYSICDCAIVALIATIFCPQYRHMWVYAACLPLLLLYAYILWVDYYRPFLPSINRAIQIEYFVRMKQTEPDGSKN
jgi:hypothetical protein